MSDSPLAGARIILTGTRKAQETADYVRRLGGVPIVAPALATVDFDSTSGSATDICPTSTVAETSLASDLRNILDEDVALVIFLTGVGARALFRLADVCGQTERLRALLAQATVVARGPKAVGALKGAGVRVDWVPPLATVEAIAEGLDRFALAGRAAVIQLSGFADDRLANQLRRQGARAIELDLYRHVPPRDAEPVLVALDAIETASVDFLTFTSAIAVREFFATAERFGRDDTLITALRAGPVVTVAVGPVTGSALSEQGVPVAIIPSTYTTGGMFRAIEQWLAARR